MTLLALSACCWTDFFVTDVPAIIQPVIVTSPVENDSDDPAIWVHPTEPGKSLVIGTDKHDPGALYVFDLSGRVIESKVVRGLRRPNNVDVEYGLMINDRPLDIAVVTERITHCIRVFALPDMKPLDGGGIEVFAKEQGEGYRSPMGIALYKRPSDGAVFAIVGRKNGPEKDYLWQYRLGTSEGRVTADLVRKFGRFSGTKEIEAIAVDDAHGYVYYADENIGIRKYHADPDAGDEELALFGTEGFAADREGISIYAKDEKQGYILVSDQESGSFNIYNRIGTIDQPHLHHLIGKINLAVNESDGSDVCSLALNETFRCGLFVAMSNDRTFQYYRWEDLAKHIDEQ